MDERWADQKRVFRTRLRTLRRERNLTQENLALAAGVSLRQYQYLESGESRNPTLDILLALAKTLEVELSDLIPLGKRPVGRPRKETSEA